MMDKSKAYDEALENAKKLKDDCQKELDKTDKTSRLADLLICGISTAEMIFPQLKESEDERIRKALIWHLKADVDFVSNGVTKAECISYLEKQKESLRDFIDDFPYSSEQEKPKIDIDKLRRDLYQSGYNDGYQHGKEDAQKEQESIEWNEEDKEALDMCLDAIPKRWKTKSGILLTKWLKDNIHLQPKQDWNEEDEEIWFALITFFKTYLQKYPPLCKDEKTQANRILKWLNTTIKSFRLHYRWKPSKEKMDALKNVAYGTYQNGDGPALRELYEQLLKLGVKEEPEYYQHFDPDC